MKYYLFTKTIERVKDNGIRIRIKTLRMDSYYSMLLYDAMAQFILASIKLFCPTPLLLAMLK